jgi:hypothetical protein
MKAPWFLALCFFVLPVSGQEDRFAFPSVEAEASLPGVGPLRRYEGLMKRWPELRAKWASEVGGGSKERRLSRRLDHAGLGHEPAGPFPGNEERQSRHRGRHDARHASSGSTMSLP